MSTIFSTIKCSVCGGEAVFQADFETDDEDEARRLHKEALKDEIIHFYSVHAYHRVEYVEKLVPDGINHSDSKLYAVAAWCNDEIKTKYGSK